jgi:HPt (histidine-containing phosphotransfer) domain-containing protein
MNDFLSMPVRVAHLEEPSDPWGSAVKLPATIAAAAEPPKGTQSPSPVDMEVFLEVAGKKERIPETARRYTEQTREDLETLQKAITAGIAAEVKRVAHKVAGSSAMCGMNAMAVLLRNVERMGHERQLANAGRVFAQVEQEFVRIKAFFANNLETTNPPAALAGIKGTKS